MQLHTQDKFIICSPLSAWRKQNCQFPIPQLAITHARREQPGGRALYTEETQPTCELSVQMPLRCWRVTLGNHSIFTVTVRNDQMIPVGWRELFRQSTGCRVTKTSGLDLSTPAGFHGTCLQPQAGWSAATITVVLLQTHPKLRLTPQHLNMSFEEKMNVFKQ